MSDNTIIRTTKLIYPQIYAYVLPQSSYHDGWIKIGYTERQDVDVRIREQIQTLGFDYAKLWSAPAQFHDTKKWFRDTHFHAYLRAKEVEQRPQTEWFYYDGYPEESQGHFKEFQRGEIDQASRQLHYQLRTEQEAAVQMTLAYIRNNPGGEFLWNAKPRFGKTLTTYDLVRRLDAQNVLVLTNRPAIASSWFEDFEDFIAWQSNYLFVSTADTLKDCKVITRDTYLKMIDQSEHANAGCIAFISLQDLKGAIRFGGGYDKLEWVEKLKWDLLVIDEAHEGVDTIRSEVAFDNITRNFTLHLSGTPFKAVASGKFSENQIYNWTYADEQDAKAAWDPESEENNPYENLPRLSLFSYQMSRMITDEVNLGAQIDGETIDFAFDLNEFFATNASGNFLHEAEVKRWLDTLSHNEKYPFSTQELRTELQHTFWLLERVASAKALAKLLRAHPVFEHYEIVLAAGDGRSEDDEVVTEKALHRVRKAIREHERTITLSVGQLALGVTVPEWTGVLMLSNVQSPSLYMQAAFRSQNPWRYEERGKMRSKQNAYVFDFAPERTLIIYDEFANNLSRKTVAGGGTTADREDNIRTLLNFFPVIAEDSAGTMVELDVRQVLTIPKFIKAQEVVRRGFMSNLLFQNIAGIFAAPEVREILEELNPVAPGKRTPSQKKTDLDIPDIQVDADGNAVVADTIVIATTDAKFGDKVYADALAAIDQITTEPSRDLAQAVTSALTQSTLGIAKEMAKKTGVTVAQAEQAVQQSAKVVAREVEIEQRKANISLAKARVSCEKAVAAAQQDPVAIAAAKERFQAQAQAIQQELAEKAKAIVTQPQNIRSVTKTILQKSEEKKKNTVEEDIRARLRGFARTIPSFLMAYGTPRTTLANFDTTLDDAVFKEVTGITLDQFRILRDTYNFFDPVVFDEAVQEFLRKKEELADYFDDAQTEDIFDYIPPQQTNQIFTPKNVVCRMVDYLEAENPGIFSDPDTTFADLYVKSGLFLTEIAKRLYKGLEKAIPDPQERLRHIFEKQIHGFAPSEIIYNIAKNFVFGNFKKISHANLKLQDLTQIATNNEETNMKFDVVVGNPPYQEETKDTSDTPIYPLFYDLAERVATKYCLISPARFLFKVGKTPAAWNDKMLNDEHLKVLFHEQISSNVFPTTDIPGGIAVVFRDSQVEFGKIGTYTIHPELNSIVKKVESHADFENIVSFIHLQQKLDLSLLYKDYPGAKNKVGSQGKEKRLTTSIFLTLEIFTESPSDESDIQILGLIKNQRTYRYIPRKYLDSHPNLKKYKVILPKSNGSGAIGEVPSTPLIGEPLVGKPLVGHTQSFISFGAFERNKDAQNCLKYVRSKFARALLGVRKVTQDNNPDTWEKVPLQDFTSQSDIDWSKTIPEIDHQLYAKYGLTKQEIAFIEEKVTPME